MNSAVLAVAICTNCAYKYVCVLFTLESLCPKLAVHPGDQKPSHRRLLE